MTLLATALSAFACRSTPPTSLAQRPLLESEERLLVGVESRAVLPARKVHSMRAAIDGECTLHTGVANLNTLTPLVFRARRRSSGPDTPPQQMSDSREAGADTTAGGALLFERIAQPLSGWLDEKITITGSVDTPIDVDLEVDGADWHGGRWSQPILTCASHATSGRSVILISLDTLRADRVAAYGGNPALMPALNEFAERSALFVNAYSQYPQTLGSHATLFTSLYPSEHGAMVRKVGEKAAHRLSPSVETLARIFARNGYATAAFTENAFVGSSFGFDVGFDVYHDAPSTLPKGNAAYAGAAAATFANAAKWLEDRPHSPFFLFVHTYEVHTPYAPQQWAFDEMLRIAGLSQPHDAPRVHPDKRSVLHNTGAQPMTAEEMRWAERLYDAEVLGLDRVLGRFLEALERAGIAEDTIVAIVSDHGEEFGEHGSMGHGQALHEEHLRVPMIVRAPEHTAGQRFSPFVGLIDLGPTLVELAGITDDSFGSPAGRSLAKWFSNAPSDDDAKVFSQLNASPLACPAGQRAAGRNCEYDAVSVRHPEHAYIRIGVTGREHLYSLRDDRKEQRDLAPDAAPSELARYRELASTFARKTVGTQTATELNPETQRRLEALGYVDPTSP